MRGKILIIDDDLDILKGLKDRVELLGFCPVTAESGEEGLRLLEKNTPSLVLLDLALPEMSGLDVLREIMKLQSEPGVENPRTGQRAQWSQLPVIVLTAHGTLDNAIEAMKLGAYDFLTKPFEMDHLTLVIEKALERQSLKKQVEQLQAQVDAPYDTIIGQSPGIQELLQIARKSADSDATVLLLGETGTGKELFARAIHRWSPRHDNTFAVVNCASLPESLLENELFGHERGAFTGADRLHQGRIEAANEGTMFLDEIGDMPLALQGRLLRVLQNHEIQRVGGTGSVEIDVRFIAATNHNLKKKVEEGTFREDLYYRLNVIPILMPPLRERKEDILDLAKFFLARHGRKTTNEPMKFSTDAVGALLQYPWPGNIRELENVIARAVVLSHSPEVTAAQLNLSPKTTKTHDPKNADSSISAYHEAMEAHSQFLIEEALRKTGGNKSKAADGLEIQRTYLNKLIKKKGISLPPT